MTRDTGFFEEAPGVRSSTRLVMIVCCFVGCTIGLEAVAFAFRFHEAVGVVTALFIGAGGFIASGAIALALHTRKGKEPGDADAPPPAAGGIP